jgi:hypothetical protein
MINKMDFFSDNGVLTYIISIINIVVFLGLTVCYIVRVKKYQSTTEMRTEEKVN